eukprot:UN07735
MVDYAEKAVERSKKRYDEGNFNFKAYFHAADCTKKDLYTELNKAHDNIFKKHSVSLISCQFAFHYLVNTSVRMNQTLKNISDMLKC